jgi:hypothetical protein
MSETDTDELSYFRSARNVLSINEPSSKPVPGMVFPRCFLAVMKSMGILGIRLDSAVNWAQLSARVSSFQTFRSVCFLGTIDIAIR